MRIYLLAHQDDEFALLQSLCNQQPLEYQVIFLTNGLQPGVLPETRNAESLKVLATVGTQQQQVTFLGGEQSFNDGSLYQSIDAAWSALLAMLDGVNVSSVYMPAWEGGHQDHDITHVLGVCLAQRYDCLAQSRQIALYNGHNLPWKLYRVQSPLEDNGGTMPVPIPWSNRLHFLWVFRHYRSQWLTWLALYPFVLYRMIFRGKELLQPVSIERLSQEPHPGPPLYEKRGCCNQRTIRESVSQFISGLG